MICRTIKSDKGDRMGELIGYARVSSRGQKLDIQEQARRIHGSFCRLIELQDDQTAMVLLQRLGIACKNGSDMKYLSNLLYEQITSRPKQSLLTYIHPIVSAVTRILDSAAPLPDVETGERRRACQFPSRSRHFVPSCGTKRERRLN